MAYQENLGLLADKPTIVVEFGNAYVKCGYSAEFSPRCIVKTTSLFSSRHNEPIMMKAFLNFDEKRRHSILVDAFHKIFFRHLLVTPKDRRVFIVDNVMCATELRLLIAQVLFNTFNVLSLAFVPQPLCACLPFKRQTALVIDVGYKHCQVVPVFEGICLVELIQYSDAAANKVHERLKWLLEEKCEILAGSSMHPAKDYSSLFTEDMLEDVKVKLCFVTSRQRGVAYQEKEFGKSVELPTPPPDAKYPFDDDKILIVQGAVRESATESLFQIDQDDKSIQQLIFDAVRACPIDIRRPMIENVIVVGGGCMIPGFMSRMKEEILHHLENPEGEMALPFRKALFFPAICKENCTSWTGASIFGSLEILPYRSVARTAYEKNSHIADWADLNNTSK